MAVIDRIATARDDVFASRIAMILMKVCVDVLNEDPGTANHANRIALARKHIRAEINTKAIAAAVIANNGTIQAAIDGAPQQRGANVPDGDLEFVLAGLYDHVSNAYA